MFDCVPESCEGHWLRQFVGIDSQSHNDPDHAEDRLKLAETATVLLCHDDMVSRNNTECYRQTKNASSFP